MTITLTREEAQQVLYTLETLNKDGWILADFEDDVYKAIETLRARLAQPEPEPVAWESRKVAQLCTLMQRVQLEPVAWMVVTQDGETIHLSTLKKASDRWRKHDPTRQVIPLYAGAA